MNTNTTAPVRAPRATQATTNIADQRVPAPLIILASVALVGALVPAATAITLAITGNL